VKIIELTAENIKRIKAVTIRPDDNLVQITGKNGQGKTSVLDSIWWALEGANHIQAEPIRSGTDTAMIRLDLGTLKITRKFRRTEEGKITTSIVVENAEGARFQSPQKIIDDLLGALAMDPLEFTRMAAKDQVNTLKRFVPDFDFAATEHARKQAFDKRTDVNRRAKELRANASAIQVAEGTPTEPVDESALIDQMQAGAAHNSAIEEAKTKLLREEQAILSARREADDLMNKAVTLRKQADEAEAAAKIRDKVADDASTALTAAAAAVPAVIDITGIREQIGKAKTVNAEVAKLKRLQSVNIDANAAEKEAAALTNKIEDLDAAKVKAVADAKMPIPGLSLSDEAVILNGVPFNQASDAEQLRTSIAMAMAMNPKLRVIRVRDGSLLDSDAMTILAEMAAANDFQIWVERVDGSGKVGFVIEDGEIKEDSETNDQPGLFTEAAE
jgi:DNA repair exonuclease SbcCD ATPase subunit